MGDNDVSKLQPPKLFGRGKAPKSPAPEPEPGATAPEAPDVTAELPTTPPAVAVTAETTAPLEPIPDDEPGQAPEESLKPKRAKAPKRPKAPKAPRQKGPKTPKGPKPARRPLPRLRRPADVALVAVVGLVVGAVLAGLTWCFVQLDAGEHLTFVYVVIVFVAAVVVGAIGLRLAKVRSPGTVAFLGTGVVAMVALCIGSGPLDSVGGAIGVIVGSAPAYALAGWITARFIDG